MEQLTKADKRERYLFACITLFQAAGEIIAAEGYGFSDEMPDEEPRQIIEDLLEVIDQIAKRTGLTFDGIKQKHFAIIKNLYVEEN